MKSAVIQLPQSRFGDLLRRHRTARRTSQLDLALEAGISARHLSFIETGRAGPSRELVLRLGETLELTMRAQNELLEAAGYATVFRETALSAPRMAGVHTALEHILRQQEPFPALVVDPGWNIVARNRAAVRLGKAFIEPDNFHAAGEASRNAMKLIFDPLLLRPYVLDWERKAVEILQRLRWEAANPVYRNAVEQLIEDLLNYPGVRQASSLSAAANDPLMTVRLRKDDLRINYFSVISTFITPQDITLEELRIKSFFPADPETGQVFQKLAETT